MNQRNLKVVLSYEARLRVVQQRARFLASCIQSKRSLRPLCTAIDDAVEGVHNAYRDVGSDWNRKNRDCLAALRHAREYHVSSIGPLEQAVIVTHMVADAKRNDDANALANAMRELSNVTRALEEGIAAIAPLREAYTKSPMHTPPAYEPN